MIEITPVSHVVPSMKVKRIQREEQQSGQNQPQHQEPENESAMLEEEQDIQHIDERV